MDLQYCDTDGNGTVDQTSFDTTGDRWRIDNAGDGVLDEVAMDTDGDNVTDVGRGPQNTIPEMFALDTDQNGAPDTSITDADENLVNAQETPATAGPYFPRPRRMIRWPTSSASTWSPWP
jgi:hypothetical protein